MHRVREILRLEGVSLTYQAENGEVKALENISLTAREGELISIIGPSGCGKSTLLSLIAGLEAPTSGKVFIDGEDVHSGEIVCKTGYMLQKDNLLDWRTIRANALLGLEIRRTLTAVNTRYTDELLRTYGLWEFHDKYPAQLSGGMRQRTALIRTLAAKPELLLLDEAFSALDYQTRLAVADDVFAILKREGKTAVIVTHDVSEAIGMADRVIVLTKRPGRIRANHKIEIPPDGDGNPVPPLERRNHPAFREHFNTIWKELEINV